MSRWCVWTVRLESYLAVGMARTWNNILDEALNRILKLKMIKLSYLFFFIRFFANKDALEKVLSLANSAPQHKKIQVDRDHEQDLKISSVDGKLEAVKEHFYKVLNGQNSNEGKGFLIQRKMIYISLYRKGETNQKL